MNKIPIRSAFLCLVAFLFLPPARAGDTTKPSSTSFIRSTLSDKESAVQTLSAEYRPASGDGPSIWLVGVSHLGTADYYKTLQTQLDRQTVVLFEGINGMAMKKGHGAAARDDGIQEKLAKAIGLQFQLDAIDYTRANFISSDLALDDLTDEIERREPPAKNKGKPAPNKGSNSEKETPAHKDNTTHNETYNTLIDAMQGTGNAGEMMNSMTGFLGSSPAMQETTKVMLIEVLGRAGEMIGAAQSGSPEFKSMFEVLLTKRNEVLFRDLRARLAKLKPSDSIAIFYGAAHMDEIARRLGNDLHYIPASQQWDTAFTADPAKSMLPPAQIRVLIEAARAQMQKGDFGLPFGSDGAKDGK